MTNTEEIKIRIKTIEQLFNSFDPAPFRERDPDAERHIVSYAREAAGRSSIDLVVYLSATTIEPSLSRELDPAIGHHFEQGAREQQIKLKESGLLGRKGLAVGLLVMLFATLVGVALTNIFPKSSFVETIEQSLIIFAWVALWRPAEILLYDCWPLIRERKLFQRLAPSLSIGRTTATQ